MEKDKLKKCIKIIAEILILIALIITVIYLITSENGIVRKLNKKRAKEKLDTAVEKFVSSEGDRDLEEYLREIEGLEEITVNREQGRVDLKIDGEELFVVIELRNE